MPECGCCRWTRWSQKATLLKVRCLFRKEREIVRLMATFYAPHWYLSLVSCVTGCAVVSFNIHSAALHCMLTRSL